MSFQESLEKILSKAKKHRNTITNYELEQEFKDDEDLEKVYEYLEDYGIEKDIMQSPMPNYGDKCVSRPAKKISRITPLGR